MINLSDLTDREKSVILINSCVYNNVRKVKIKNNFDEVLKTEFHDSDYSDEKSLQFFDKYRGKEIFIMSDGFESNDYFIIEDNNFVITKDCFEEL